MAHILNYATVSKILCRELNMLKSMTAFGRKEAQTQWGELVWELKSVNHRYLDIVVRLPDDLRSIEPDVREKVAERCRRGRIECLLRFMPTPAQTTEVPVNEPWVKALIGACHQIEEHMINAARISPIDILSWPGVITEQNRPPVAVEQEAIALLDQALVALNQMQVREGDKLHGLLARRCQTIKEIVTQERDNRSKVLQRQKSKLLARIEELSVAVDSGRLEQELVYMAQRLDVEEELDRLQAHINEVLIILEKDEPVGRRLDFLMQELNREANTLSAKSSDVSTTQGAVDLKVLIEQMREQIQNIA